MFLSKWGFIYLLKMQIKFLIFILLLILRNKKIKINEFTRIPIKESTRTIWN